MSEEDKEQKTESPTQKRIEDAHKEGQYPFSRELGHFFLFTALTIVVAASLPGMLTDARRLLVPFIAQPDLMAVDPAGNRAMFIHIIQESMVILMVPFLVAIVSAIAASMVQTGVVWNAQGLMPKLNRISPLKGFGRIASMRSLVEFIKSLVKLTVVGIICWFALRSYIPQLNQLPGGDTAALLAFLSHAAVKLLIWISAAMFFIALADVLYQRFDFMKNLRMSKQEIRDEYKQQEGDPHIKQKLKQLRMERARNRMMAAVPKANVVITNPTHYAVALQYEGAAMSAPKVVAKGIDYLALTIRRIAEENDVAIVENAPLARALYAGVEVDEEIPYDHYKAVAEVISYVYRLKGKIPPRK